MLTNIDKLLMYISSIPLLIMLGVITLDLIYPSAKTKNFLKSELPDIESLIKVKRILSMILIFPIVVAVVDVFYFIRSASINALYILFVIMLFVILELVYYILKEKRYIKTLTEEQQELYFKISKGKNK